MAYGGAREDPVLTSLQALGQSMRGASADVLGRRRLDIEEQGLLQRQEQERDLARLRTLTQEQTGATDLEKVRGTLALQQSAERRAQGQESRAAEIHPRQVAALETSTAAQEASRQRVLAMTPVEVAQGKADIAYKGSQARLAEIHARVGEAELKAINQPVRAADFMPLIEATNPELVEPFQSIFPPDRTFTMLDLKKRMDAAQSFYSSEMLDLGIASFDRKRHDPSLSPQDRVQAEDDYRQALVRRGRTPPGGDDEILAAMASRTKVLLDTKDPVAKQQLYDDIQVLTDVYKGAKNKGGQLAANSAELMTQIGPAKYRGLIEQVKADVTARQGFGVGSDEDFFMDVGRVQQPSTYMTPNQLFPLVAGQVPAATADEWKVYLQGGKMADGTVYPADPTITTQAKANTKKREVFVTDLHRQQEGNKERLKALALGSRAPEAPAPPTPPPATPPTQAARPFGARTTQIQDEITAQLRQSLGREPTPQEVEARLQELRSPSFVPGGGLSLLGAARKLAEEQNMFPALTPEDRLRRLREHQQRGSIPPTGANEFQDR